MAEVTKATVEMMLRNYDNHEHSPLTIWEERQLAQAWLDRESLRAELAALQSERNRVVLEAGFLWHALKDLSFDCDGVTCTVAPTRGTYNDTFAVIQAFAKKYQTSEHYQTAVPAQTNQRASAVQPACSFCGRTNAHAWIFLQMESGAAICGRCVEDAGEMLRLCKAEAADVEYRSWSAPEAEK